MTNKTIHRKEKVQTAMLRVWTILEDIDALIEWMEVNGDYKGTTPYTHLQSIRKIYSLHLDNLDSTVMNLIHEEVDPKIPTVLSY